MSIHFKLSHIKLQFFDKIKRLSPGATLKNSFL